MAIVISKHCTTLVGYALLKYPELFLECSVEPIKNKVKDICAH